MDLCSLWMQINAGNIDILILPLFKTTPITSSLTPFIEIFFSKFVNNTVFFNYIHVASFWLSASLEHAATEIRNSRSAMASFLVPPTNPCGPQNRKKIRRREMNFTRAMLSHGNGIRSRSAPMYDPAIWLAGVRLRGNSEEIGMLFEACTTTTTMTSTTSTTICIHENAGNVSDVVVDVFSTLENESDAIIRLSRQFLFVNFSRKESCSLFYIKLRLQYITLYNIKMKSNSC